MSSTVLSKIFSTSQQSDAGEVSIVSRIARQDPPSKKNTHFAQWENLKELSEGSDIKSIAINNEFIEKLRSLKKEIQENIKKSRYPHESYTRLADIVNEVKSLFTNQVKDLFTNNDSLDQLKSIDIVPEDPRIINQFRQQAQYLRKINKTLIDQLEVLQLKEFKNFSLDLKTLDLARKNITRQRINREEKQVALNSIEKTKESLVNSKNGSIFSNLESNIEDRILKNMAIIVSSELVSNSEDTNIRDLLSNSRLKNIFNQIYEFAKENYNFLKNPKNPFEQRNFNSKIFRREIESGNWDELEKANKTQIRQEIKEINKKLKKRDLLSPQEISALEREKTKLERKKLDLIYSQGVRTGYIKILENAYFSNDIHEKFAIIEQILKDTFSNKTNAIHKFYAPDGTLSSGDLTSLGNPFPQDKHEKYFKGTSNTVGNINEQRTLFASKLLSQIIERGNIGKYSQDKVDQLYQTNLKLDPKLDFKLKLIINVVARGPADISGSDLLVIIEKNQKFYMGRLQAKSSELSAYLSELEKYVNTPTFFANQVHKLPQRRKLDEREHSSFVTDEKDVTFPDVIDENPAGAIDQDLVLKVGLTLNRNTDKNFLELTENQLKEIEKLVNNKDYFHRAGNAVSSKSNESEIHLFNILAPQGFLSDLQLAYSKYPYQLKNSIEKQGVDSISMRSFYKRALRHKRLINEEFGNTNYTIPQQYLQEIYTQMHSLNPKHPNKSYQALSKEPPLDTDYIKPIIYKVMLEQKNGNKIENIDIARIVKPYFEEAKSYRIQLNKEFNLVNKLLKQRLKAMLDKIPFPLNTYEKESLVKFLKKNRYSFDPSFFHAINSENISSIDDIKAKLPGFNSLFKTPDDTKPAFLA